MTFSQAPIVRSPLPYEYLILNKDFNRNCSLITTYKYKSCILKKYLKWKKYWQTNETRINNYFIKVLYGVLFHDQILEENYFN